MAPNCSHVYLRVIESAWMEPGYSLFPFDLETKDSGKKVYFAAECRMQMNLLSVEWNQGSEDFFLRGLEQEESSGSYSPYLNLPPFFTLWSCAWVSRGLKSHPRASGIMEHNQWKGISINYDKSRCVASEVGHTVWTSEDSGALHPFIVSPFCLFQFLEIWASYRQHIDILGWILLCPKGAVLGIIPGPNPVATSSTVKQKCLPTLPSVPGKGWAWIPCGSRTAYPQKPGLKREEKINFMLSPVIGTVTGDRVAVPIRIQS